MQNIIRKWKKVCVCVCMLAFVFSVTVFATEGEGTPEQEVPVTVEYKLVLEASEYVYTGAEIMPKAEVQVLNQDGTVVEGSILVEGVDYQVSYLDNVNAGTATVEVKGLEGYADVINLKETFVILPASIEDAEVTLSRNYYTYNGKAKKPEVTVEVNGKVLDENDYVVEYTDNVEPGTAKVTATGTGNYEGTAKASYKISLDETDITLKRSYNRVRVYWSKVTGADGYQIYRSTSKNSGYSKIATVSAGKERKYTDKGRIHNKKYYYKIRAYRKVNGKNVYGDYSPVSSITVRVSTPSIKNIYKTNSSSLTIKWTQIDGATGYRVYRATSKNGTYKRIATLKGNKTLSYKDTGRVCGRTYYYKIKAYRTVDGTIYNGSASEIKSCATRPVKVKWSDFITYEATKVMLEWNKAKGAEGYQIYRATSKNGTYKRVKTINSASTTKWTNTGLKKGKVYYYKIRAFCETDGKTTYGMYSEIFDRKKAGWRYSTYDGKKIKLYYNANNEVVQDVSKLIGKQDSYVIKVNKQKCTVTVWAKDGDNGYIIPVKSFVCSPGYSTPTGTFYTPAKYRWHELMGPCWGQWNTRIRGGILFHSVFYNSYHNNDSLSVSAYNKLGTICSHGCVRLRAGDAKWIYDNCKLGTKVIIYNSSNPGPFGKKGAVKLPYWHTWDPTDPNKFAKCDARGCH